MHIGMGLGMGLAEAAQDSRQAPANCLPASPARRRRRLAERVRHLGWADPGGMLFWGGVKDFADGSLGSRTALFHAPYADAPAAAGARAIELPRLRQLVAEADAVGLQVGVHAIGDQAVDEVAAIYAELAAGRANSSPAAAGTQPGRQRRRPPHRVEHAQHISGRAAAGRLAAAGVAVTPNPLHLPADAGILLERLGPERAGAAHSYAIRTLLEAGMTCAFASDWPVVPLDPAGEAAGREGRGGFIVRVVCMNRRALRALRAYCMPACSRMCCKPAWGPCHCPSPAPPPPVAPAV